MLEALKYFLKGAIAPIVVIELIGSFFGFKDEVHKFVADYPILTVLLLCGYGLYVCIVWDAKRLVQKKEYNSQLKGASRRKRRRRRSNGE